MGISNSKSRPSDVGGQGQHFDEIIQPQKYMKKASPDTSFMGSASGASPAPTTSSSNLSTAPTKTSISGASSNVKIDYRAKILRRLDHVLLWDTFLSSSYDSFALTPNETISILRACSNYSENSKSTKLDLEINGFVDLICELSDGNKIIDFMAVISSIILLSEMPIEKKIENLFFYITLNNSTEKFGFEEFVVAMFSFERGLSHALGKVACDESTIREIAKNWITLADPNHKAAPDSNTRIEKANFFEFCTNRQHIVRRLLEGLTKIGIQDDVNIDMKDATPCVLERSNSSDNQYESPSAGDQWMANPAWRKTAEKMIPPSVKFKNELPNNSLTLEWVHGYRGFDCRNNLKYATSAGYFVIYHTASVVIAQNTDDGHGKKQFFFAEHNDDITSIASIFNPNPSNPEKNSLNYIPENVCLVASGEIGKIPSICLTKWTFSDNKSCQIEPLAILKGFHTKGIVQLAFSRNGKELFSVGMEYSIAVYCSDLTDKKDFGKMVWSAQGPKEKILDLSCCGEHGDSFVSCGEKHVLLWEKKSIITKTSSVSYKQEPIAIGKEKNSIMLCVSSIKDTNFIVLTTANGSMLLVKDFKMVAKFEAHHNVGINALYTNNTYIITGGREGLVKVWSVPEIMKLGYGATPTPFASFYPFTKSVPTPIRSINLCANSQTTSYNLLLGSIQCEVVEINVTSYLADSDKKGSVEVDIDTSRLKRLNNGHFKDELWGLDVRTRVGRTGVYQICTVGDDGYFRLWDATTHSEIFRYNMEGIARCCALSHDGMYLAVGFGGGTEKAGAKCKESGMVRVYRFEDSKNTLTKVTEIKEAKQWISCIRFSPDDTILAVGARDNSIYIYSVIQQFKRKAKFSKHNAGIIQMDFSVCGRYLQSCCSAYEILYSEVNTGNLIVNSSSVLIDTEWDTWSCTLGWPVIGIWSNNMDGSDINAVSRSAKHQYIATADDFGKVKIFCYPATKEGGNVFSSYSGHSSHVTNVKWLGEHDDYLISTGGLDKAIFVWKHKINAVDGKGAILPSSYEPSAKAKVENLFLDSLPEGGDEFCAVKPWLGAIVAPNAWTNKDPAKAAPFLAALSDVSNWINKLSDCKSAMESYNNQGNFSGAKEKMFEIEDCYKELTNQEENIFKVSFKKMSASGVDSNSAPESDELELDWIHGYRGFDSRNNCFYFKSKNGGYKIVYFAASLGVVYDPIKNTQQYFRGHSDDVISIAVHDAFGESPIVASGQCSTGSTFIWDPQTIVTLAVLNTKQKSVCLVNFSKDGRLLVSLGEDKSIVISDWKSQTILINTKGEGAVTHHSCAFNSNSLITCGDKFIKLWVMNGRNLTGSKLSISSNPQIPCEPQAFLCAINVHDKILFTGEDGFIYIHDQKQIIGKQSHPLNTSSEKISQKNSAISALSYDAELDIVLSGSKNGEVAVWNSSKLALSSGSSSNAKVKGSKSLDLKLELLGTFNVQSVISDIAAKQVMSISMRKLEPVDAPFLSVEDIVIVIGTRGCDLFEVYFSPNVAKDQKNVALKKIITRGHCNDELWGLSCHPLKPEYCTVGDDKTLRFYSIIDKSMIKYVSLGTVARTCCYHPNGNLIAIGCGGRVGKGKEVGSGAVRIYEANMMPGKECRLLVERSDAKQWISDIKFSSDGTTLVASAHDCKIYIYNVSYKYSETNGKVISEVYLNLRHVNSKHNSVINHIDLSVDGRFLQSTCSAYELLFCDVGNGKQITSPSELKDVRWDTWTSTLGWPVQGIWEPGMDGSDINAIDRSHSGHLLALGDDFGKVKLYHYPSVTEASGHLTYSGHSSHVMNVRWSLGDEYLISCGGNDKCIMMWKHSMVGRNNVSTSAEEKDGDKDFVNLSKTDNTLVIEDFDAPTGGDESGAVKPWLGAIRPPKFPPPISKEIPNINLNLKWVFGYTSASAGACNAKVSNNLYYNLNGDVIYPAAAVGIKLSRNVDKANESIDHSQMTQSYFQGHNDDILSMAISSCRRFIATGQTSSSTSKGKGSIIIWDANECRKLSHLENCHARGVSSLCFGPNGDKLLSVGLDDNCTHILWTDVGGSWSRVQKSSEEKGEKGTLFFSRFVNPLNSMVVKGDYEFISCGSFGISFWKLEGARLLKKPGRFGKYKQAPVLCAANIYINDQYKLIFGTSTGDLFVFDEREATVSVDKAHNGAILAIKEGGDKSSSFLITGGKDSIIKVWNQSLQAVSTFNISKLSLVDGSIASIDILPDFSKRDNLKLTFLVGTYGGEIIEITNPLGPEMSSNSSKSSNLDISNATATVLTHSHFSGELWGVAPHPTNKDIIASVGDDSTLRIWSISGKKMIQSKDLDWPARSIAWDFTGTKLAVGFNEAVKGGYKQKKNKKDVGGGGQANESIRDAVHIYNVLDSKLFTLELLASGCKSLAWISDVKFSPDNSKLAVCSHDKALYMYDISSNSKDMLSKYEFKFDKNSSAVLNVDFTTDSKYFMTNSQAGELLFGHLKDGKQETSASKVADYNNFINGDEDERYWSSFTCKLGWPVQGIFPSGSDLSDINSVDRNHNFKLIATANDSGLVKVFRYPCVEETAKFVPGAGHSSHVTSVKWAIGNSLISAGGNDKCIFVWDVEEN